MQAHCPVISRQRLAKSRPPLEDGRGRDNAREGKEFEQVLIPHKALSVQVMRAPRKAFMLVVKPFPGLDEEVNGLRGGTAVFQFFNVWHGAGEQTELTQRPLFLAKPLAIQNHNEAHAL